MSLPHAGPDLADRLAPHQGDWLRKSLEVSGVSAIEMAGVIDVSRRTMTNYLAGRTRPRRLALREWATRTGVPVSYLETGTLVHPPGLWCTPRDSNPEPTDYGTTSDRVTTRWFGPGRVSDAPAAHRQVDPRRARPVVRPVVTLRGAEVAA